MKDGVLPTLGVNIDHVATLRQARHTAYPSVLEAARSAARGGADQITVHLREDRRHIQDKDVFDLKKTIGIPLNLEMSIANEIVGIAADLRPDVATLVPEKREELTTEGGLDCKVSTGRIEDAVKRLKDAGIMVSLFIDPDPEQVKISKKIGADAVELHTGTYCDSSGPRQAEELRCLKEAAHLARGLNLKVCAGHGLNYENIYQVVVSIPEFEEYNIGHSIIARAVFVGIEDAVREMKKNILAKEFV